MSGDTTNQTFLGKKSRTHDFSVRAGLVLHEMVGIIGDRKARVIANLAEWHISRTDKAVGKFASADGNAGRSLGIAARENRRMISALVEIERDLRAWDSVSVGSR